jgi:hypothetical protein
MIPEEDRPPAWLADYGAIDADIQAMADFAADLNKEVVDGYGPHLSLVTTSMLTPLPAADPNFPELQQFLDHHYEVQTATYSNAYNYRDSTGELATAAKTISTEYSGSDAFSRAQVNDVDKALAHSAQVPASTDDRTVLP